MTTRQPTCEERIAEHLAGRLETIGALIRVSRVNDADDVAALSDADKREIADITDSTAPDELCEAAQDAIYQLPLSVETFKLVRVLLSTGGPADWLEARIDTEGEIDRIEYVFQDWLDSASRVLDGDEFDQAARFIEELIPE